MSKEKEIMQHEEDSEDTQTAINLFSQLSLEEKKTILDSIKSLLSER